MCGIIGVFQHDGSANIEIYEGLLMLQHRGQVGGEGGGQAGGGAVKPPYSVIRLAAQADCQGTAAGMLTLGSRDGGCIGEKGTGLGVFASRLLRQP